MATATPNIGLTKPLGTENYDIDVVNNNSDIIDTEITDAKVGSNLRVFKVKNDLTDQDNVVNRISGDTRYIRISQSITAFIHLTYSHATDAVARFNQASAGKIASFLQNGIEKSYVSNDGTLWVDGKRLVDTVELQAVADDAVASAFPIGGMIDFASDGAPSGYLVCNGGVVSQTTYAALYAVIGNTWANTGGASTPAAGDFRLPPQQKDGFGLFHRGVGANNGVVGTYEADIYKSHNHSASSSSTGNHRHSYTYYKPDNDNNGNWSLAGDAAYNDTGYTNYTGNHSHTITVNSSGGTETRPRSITTLKCIKF